MATDIPGLMYADPGFNMGAAPTSSGFNWRGIGRDVGKFYQDAGPGAVGGGFGTMLSFVGSILAARQAKKASDFNSAIITRNAQAAATAAEIEAQQHQRNQAVILQDIFLVRQAQAEAERTQQEQSAYLASQTRAIIGASGLMMSGSPLAVQEYGIQARARETAAVRYRADLEERRLRDAATMEGYTADVARYGAAERLRVGGAQGALARYGGRQQRAAGYTGAFGGLASGEARTVAAVERHRASQGPVLR